MRAQTIWEGSNQNGVRSITGYNTTCLTFQEHCASRDSRPCTSHTSGAREAGPEGRGAPTRLMMPKMRPPRENMVRYSPSRLLGTGVSAASACEMVGEQMSAGDLRRQPLWTPSLVHDCQLQVQHLSSSCKLKTQRFQQRASYVPQWCIRGLRLPCRTDRLSAQYRLGQTHLQVVVDAARGAERGAGAVHHDGEDAERHVDVHLRQ